jgi:S1-C subfamily serine protease
MDKTIVRATSVMESEMAFAIASFSQELATVAEQVGSSVVTVQARHRVPSSGIHWRDGVVVTANHTVRREDDIPILIHGEKRVSARLVGRDPGTDLAVLKFDQDAGLATPQFTDASTLKLANFVLALGRTRFGNLVASAGIIGGLGGEWRSWRGAQIDQSIRLDLALYPGFSGGPLVNVEGKVLGLNTNGFGRGRAVSIPVSTVNRTVNELLDKGHIARPYLGVAMQPVVLPEAVRSKLKSETAGGLMVLHVEPGGPADKAGIVLGDVIVELQGKPALDTEHIQDVLASAKVNQKIGTTVVRGGVPLELSITVGERPAK